MLCLQGCPTLRIVPQSRRMCWLRATTWRRHVRQRLPTARFPGRQESRAACALVLRREPRRRRRCGCGRIRTGSAGGPFGERASDSQRPVPSHVLWRPIVSVQNPCCTLCALYLVRIVSSLRRAAAHDYSTRQRKVQSSKRESDKSRREIAPMRQPFES